MKRKLSLYRSLAFAIIAYLFISCKTDEVKKVEIDNQFALSLFSDEIKIGDLLNNIDSTVSQYVKVKSDGSIYAYFADSVKNAVVADDILASINDVTFDVENEFELPTIPPSPIPVPVELPLDDFFSIPFDYEGYEINSVVMKNGKIKLNLSTNFNIIDELVLATDNIILSNGESFEVSLNLNSDGSDNVEIDLTNSTVTPIDGNLVFSAKIVATISDEGIGGTYELYLDGGLFDIEFKSIDGSIQDMGFEFVGTESINLNFPKLYGDLKIVTPEFTIKYINTFGFDARGFIDSLYLTDVDNNKIGIVKNWEQVELSLNSTDGAYDYISALDMELVDEIELLHDYKAITFNGNIIMGCDAVADNMITDDSHIDIVADVSLPLEFSIENLMFIDTLDFNLNLNSENEAGNIVENIFDELEFKFAFENKLPIQIKPQMYMLDKGVVIDSLFDGNTLIHAGFENNSIEDVLVVKIVDEKLHNIQQTDKLLLNIGLSSCGENVVINANDYFNLRIGLKTKTTEIDLEEMNF